MELFIGGIVVWISGSALSAVVLGKMIAVGERRDALRREEPLQTKSIETIAA